MKGRNWLNDNWRLRSRLGIDWMEDGFLMRTGMVKQGFSRRTGGVSLFPCDTLNIGYTWDDPESVKENRRRLASAADIPPDSWSCLRQVHGISVKTVVGEDTGKGILDPSVELPAYDGQITNEPGVTLVTLHADCLPLYVLDPKKSAVGLAHAGWKGTLANIAGALVEAMTASFGSDPADLLASVGPGAGGCHYEIGEPVLSEAQRRFGGMPGAMDVLLRPSSEPGKAYLDLGKANALLLGESGIPDRQISLSGICTICEQSFFSHRRGEKGRQAAFFALRRQ